MKEFYNNYDNELNQVIKSFYDRAKAEIKNFNNITDSRIEEIKNMAEEYKTKPRIHTYSEYEKYISILKFLIYNNELKRNEKMIFLIYAIDPSLECLKLFDETVLITKESILREKDNKQAFVDNNLRKEQISEYKAKIREKLGYCPEGIIKYERMLKIRLVLNQELETNVKQYYQIIPMQKEILDNKEIDQEKLEYISKLVSIYKKPNNYKDTVYHIIVQYKKLGLTSNILERLAFLILVYDPNFKGIEIYEEESNWKVIIERFKEELNVKMTQEQAQDFIKAERKLLNSRK